MRAFLWNLSGRHCFFMRDFSRSWDGGFPGNFVVVVSMNYWKQISTFFYYLIIIALEFLQFLVKISLVSRIRPGLRWDGGRARERPLRRVEGLGAGIYILAITPSPPPQGGGNCWQKFKGMEEFRVRENKKRKKRVKMEEKREIGVKKRKLSLFVSLFNIDGWP